MATSEPSEPSRPTMMLFGFVQYLIIKRSACAWGPISDLESPCPATPIYPATDDDETRLSCDNIFFHAFL